LFWWWSTNIHWILMVYLQLSTGLQVYKEQLLFATYFARDAAHNKLKNKYSHCVCFSCVCVDYMFTHRFKIRAHCSHVFYELTHVFMIYDLRISSILTHYFNMWYITR
jgi:hypothetical protein